MLYVPVNSQGHVGTLPPSYGTFTQNEDVMTSNKCLKYPSNQAKKAYRYGGFDVKPLFLGKLRPERIIRWSVSSEEALPGDASSQSISLGPNERGPLKVMIPLINLHC